MVRVSRKRLRLLYTHWKLTRTIDVYVDTGLHSYGLYSVWFSVDYDVLGHRRRHFMDSEKNSMCAGEHQRIPATSVRAL